MEHTWHSPTLGQEMTVGRYGHAGKPILVFSCQDGRHVEYRDFGMLDVLKPHLEAGKIQLFTTDSWDGRSWTNTHLHPHERALQAERYDRYITEEVVPFIKHHTGRDDIFTNGCSMGGYHAANFLFRHPNVFHGCIAIAGIYQLNLFIGDYMDEAVYYQTPLAYLKNLNDPRVLAQIRSREIVVCVGQGAWEEPMLTETRALKALLEEKGIPAWVDIWGLDVNHDWPWWKKMIPYFLGHLGLGV